jgi:hypothetical protein
MNFVGLQLTSLIYRWGSRYKNGSDEVRDDIVDFALQKLIPIEDCSKSGPNAKLGNVGMPLDAYMPLISIGCSMYVRPSRARIQRPDYRSTNT